MIERHLRYLIGLLIGLVLCVEVFGQSKYALVIGNAKYNYLQTLNNAENDAVDIGETLTRIGFEVDAHTNLSREGLKEAINEFGLKARLNDIVLFYYAGHGIELSGKNYFVPVDALANSVSEVKRTCVNASAVTHLMKIAKAQANIIILDACRENPFTLLPSDKSSDGLALMDAPTGTIISFATAPGNVASDGTGRNGVYTGALLKHLPTFDLDIKDIFESVRNTVVLETNNKQIPWESTSLIQEVVLRPKPELPIQINILEGDTITYKGNGDLHAVSNLKGVAFNWFHNGHQFVNTATVNINKTGLYRVKAISKAGQIILSDPVFVQIKSFVDPQPWIVEGTNITLKPNDKIHGKCNVRGRYQWIKDNNVVGEGSELEVEVPGIYTFQVETHEGVTQTSESINVRIKE